MHYSVLEMISLETVIEGCKQGNRAMQKELYDRYSSRFYALCRRYTNDTESANEILTDGFIDVFSEIGNYRNEGSFEGWMQTIFLRKAIRFYHANHRRQQTFKQLDSTEYDGGYADIATQIDIREALLVALRNLSNEERMVFNLVAVEDCSLKEAGKMMNIPVSTVKSRYYRALQTVRERLTKQLGENFIKNYR
jgi:RNA polymerase sigma-70 factor (ECF subfamily)